MKFPGQNTRPYKGIKMETEKPGQIRKQGKNMSNKEEKLAPKQAKQD